MLVDVHSRCTYNTDRCLCSELHAGPNAAGHICKGLFTTARHAQAAFHVCCMELRLNLEPPRNLGSAEFPTHMHLMQAAFHMFSMGLLTQQGLDITYHINFMYKTLSSYRHCSVQAAFHVFGMELLTQLDLDATNQFFEAFFRLPPAYWQGFLASRLSSARLVLFAAATFMVCFPALQELHVVGLFAAATCCIPPCSHVSASAGAARHDHYHLYNHLCICIAASWRAVACVDDMSTDLNCSQQKGHSLHLYRRACETQLAWHAGSLVQDQVAACVPLPAAPCWQLHASHLCW